MKEKVSTLKIVKLPERYSTVKTLISNVSEYSAPLCTTCIPDFNFEKLRAAVNEEVEWLRSGVQNTHAWSSSKHRQSPRERDISTILPLIREKVNSLNCQYHCMNIIMDTIGEINPSQTSVDVCDQPIYALTKQLQWRFPSHFRKYFCLFGGLHVKNVYWFYIVIL